MMSLSLSPLLLLVSLIDGVVAPRKTLTPEKNGCNDDHCLLHVIANVIAATNEMNSEVDKLDKDLTFKLGINRAKMVDISKETEKLLKFHDERLKARIDSVANAVNLLQSKCYIFGNPYYCMN